MHPAAASPSTPAPAACALQALSARQRAMLAEMGLAIWPRRAALATLAHAPHRAPHASSHAPHAAAPAQALRPPMPKNAPQPQPQPQPQAMPDVGALCGPQLRAAAQQCSACALCAGRLHSVWDAPQGRCLIDAPAEEGTQALPRWMFVLDAPTAAENASGIAAQGDAGVLLRGIVAALGLEAQQQVYISHATKCALPPGRQSDAAQLAQCAVWLRREMALLRPRVIVALGRGAALAALGRDEAPGRLRGQVFAATDASGQSYPLVASYPLQHLLRHPLSKAQAWQDLCLAWQQTQD